MRKQFRNAVISYNNNDYNVTYSNNEESLWKKIAEIAYKNNFSSNMLIATDVDDKSVRQAIVEIEKEEKKNRSKYRLKLKEDTFYLKKSLYKEKKYRLINSEKDIRIKYDLLPNNLGPRTLSVGVITNNIGEEGLDRIEDGIVLHPFPSQLYWLNCYLKEFEGYKDYSMYLEKDEEEDKIKQFFRKPDEKEMKESDYVELSKLLSNMAKDALKDYGMEIDFYSNKSPYTKAQIKSVKKIYERLCDAGSVGEFNDIMNEFISIAEPKFRKGMTVNSYKVLDCKSAEEERKKISERLDMVEGIINSMDTIYNENRKSSSNNDMGNSILGNVIVKKESPEEMQKTIASKSPYINTKQSNKIIAIYDIESPEQEKKYKAHLETLNKKEETYLFHGSRNENWASIVKNNLKISIKLVANGSAFGLGIYLANDSDKSDGYCSLVGSRWAKGKDKIAIMGIYAVATGNTYDPGDRIIGGNPKDTKNLLKMFKEKGYDSLHYKADKNSMFVRDEHVVYSEDACVLRKLIIYGN